MNNILDFLSKQPLMVVFLSLFIGFTISRIKVGGMLIGSVGVLLSGMIFGIMGLGIPNEIKTLGVLLFIYAVGVQAGPKIFSIFKKNNVKYLGVAAAIFGAVTLITFVFSKIMHLDKTMFVGIYCGVFGGAAALGNLISNQGNNDSLLAYSFAYPLSLIFTITFVSLMVRRYHLEENPRLDITIENPVVVKDEGIISEKILIKFLRDNDQTRVGLVEDKYGIVIKEIIKDGRPKIPDQTTELAKGDILLAEGYQSDIKRFIRAVGVAAIKNFIHPRGVITRPILFTNRDLDGKTLAEIGIRKNYNCVVTRIWRAGVMIAAPESWVQLEVGDALVVTGDEEGLDRFTAVAGKQKKATGEIDFFSMSFIILLGIILGEISIPNPMGGALKLGMVGGTLIVALVVGYFRRVGFIYGQLTPHARNVMKEFGLTFFLLGVGTDAGAIFNRFTTGQILGVVSASLVVILGFLLVVFFIILFYKGRRKAATILSVLCGAITNTVALGVIVEKTGSDEFMIPYASVYPVAQVVLIVLAQVLYMIY